METIRPHSRRPGDDRPTRARLARAVAVAAALLGALVAASCDSDDPNGPAPDVGPTFSNPPEFRSEGGVLTATLEARTTTTRISGETASVRLYNGRYIPPLLRVEPGDTIRLELVNAIDQDTNLHFHGLNVSPLANSDNIFVLVPPEESFDYEIRIPEDHPTGLFWYHPHVHHNTEFQTFNGMSGGLVVDGLLDPFPPDLRGIAERILLLKDIQIVRGTVPPPGEIDSNARTTRTVNGLVNPTMTISPGETQLWRVGNIGPDIYYRLKLDGHTLFEIARDGNRHNQVVPRDEILLPPSSRVEFLVQGGPPGSYAFRTLEFNTGPDGDDYPDVTLATLVSEGPEEPPAVLPTALPPVEDLRTRTVDRERTFVFSETQDADGDEQFFINGRQFDMNRVDTTVQLGDIEEWTLVNDSDEMHVFHIHQLDFQVIDEDGRAVPFAGYQDTVNLPVRGSVTVRIPFTRPAIVGKFVYHCHIMAHEDRGMMAVVEVVE